MFTDKNGMTEVQFLRSHRPLARRLTELEAENAELRHKLDRLNDERVDALDAAFWDGMSKCACPAPEGYVLVPVEPTAEMVRAFNGYRPIGRANFACRYEAMITARPEVP